MDRDTDDLHTEFVVRFPCYLSAEEQAEVRLILDFVIEIWREVNELLPPQPGRIIPRAQTSWPGRRRLPPLTDLERAALGLAPVERQPHPPTQAQVANEVPHLRLPVAVPRPQAQAPARAQSPDQGNLSHGQLERNEDVLQHRLTRALRSLQTQYRNPHNDNDNREQ